MIRNRDLEFVVLLVVVLSLPWPAVADSPTSGNSARITALVEATKDSDHSVREAAIRALARIDGPEVVKRLMELMQEPNGEIRYQAAKILASRKRPECLDAFISALGDLYPRVRTEAARGLGQIEDPKAVGPLVDALSAPDNTTQDTARESLVKFGDAAVPALSKALAARYTIRVQIVECLSRIGTEPALTALRDAMKDTDWRVRDAAIRKLGGSRLERRDLLLLCNATSDSIPAVRLSAVERLRSHAGNGSVKTALIQALEDSCAAVRALALGSLERSD
ncbi:hypothetical protein LCGC14_3022620, partial [marine sediment metagenome]